MVNANIAKIMLALTIYTNFLRNLMIFLKPLKEITSTHKPIYPANATWDDTVAYLLSSEPDKTIIAELREAIRVDGLRSPVVLGEAYDTTVNGEEIYVPAVMDGTHRMVASILENTEFVLVENSTDRKQTPTEKKYIAVDVTLKQDMLDKLTRVEEDDIVSNIFDYLRSFKLNDNIWLVSDLSMGKGNVTTHYYFEVPTTKEVLALTEQKVTELLTETKVTEYVSSVTVTVQEDEED